MRNPPSAPEALYALSLQPPHTSARAVCDSGGAVCALPPEAGTPGTPRSAPTSPLRARPEEPGSLGCEGEAAWRNTGEPKQNVL